MSNFGSGGFASPPTSPFLARFTDRIAIVSENGVYSRSNGLRSSTVSPGTKVESPGHSYLNSYKRNEISPLIEKEREDDFFKLPKRSYDEDTSSSSSGRGKKRFSILEPLTLSPEQPEKREPNNRYLNTGDEGDEGESSRKGNGFLPEIKNRFSFPQNRIRRVKSHEGAGRIELEEENDPNENEREEDEEGNFVGKLNYKPYNLRQWRTLRQKIHHHYWGGLGPDLENEVLIKKKKVVKKKRSYSANVRIVNYNELKRIKPNYKTNLFQTRPMVLRQKKSLTEVPRVHEKRFQFDKRFRSSLSPHSTKGKKPFMGIPQIYTKNRTVPGLKRIRWKPRNEFERVQKRHEADSDWMFSEFKTEIESRTSKF